MVADAYSPSYLGSWGGRITEGLEIKATTVIVPLCSSLGNKARTRLRKKNKKGM